MSGLAVLIIPFLEELGLTAAIAGTAESLGASTAVAEAAGTAGTLYTANQIEKQITPVKTLEDKYFKEHDEPGPSDYFGFLTQDPNYAFNREKRRQDFMNLQKNSNNTTYLDSYRQDQIDKLNSQAFNATARSFNIDSRLSTSDAFTNPYSAIVKSNAQLSLNQPIRPNNPTPEQQIKRDPYGYDTDPRELARYVIDISKKLATTENLNEATAELLDLEPEAYTLSQKVLKFISDKSLPNTEEYKRIAQIYNGKSINKNSFKIQRNATTKLIEVLGTDETGTTFTLPETTGLTIPTIPPYVFVGPLSKNNSLPSDNVEDFYAFFHDYSWRNGNFNRIGDLQFISRLAQNMDRVKPEHRKFVLNTIIYFSNVSLTLSKFVEQPEDDIFKELSGVSPADPEYATLRTEFYDTMNKELTTYTKTDGFFVSQKENQLESLINNFEIQLG